MEKVIIIGSGPAAHTAAIYAARANMQPLMFEGFMAGGIAAGGQLTTTTIIENFPGFSEWIDGNQLMMQMRQQSINAGARIETITVDKVDLNLSPFKVYGANQIYEAKSLIIATWAIAQRMGIPGETTYWQKGISACAVCDGALPMFRNKVLVVIGWGDSAIEEANHLTHFASKVIILVRRDKFRASQAMQKRALENPKIDIRWNTEALQVIGENVLTGVKVKNNQTNEDIVIECAGLFYAIGHKPNTAFLDWQVRLDDMGYIMTYGRLCEEAISGKIQLTPEEEKKFKDGKQRYMTSTSVSWVFAAWDVQDKNYRQAITSAGTGCMAALEAEKWVSEH